jgi:hypothetical protein
MGGTGLEPVTPSLSKRLRRSRPFALVRLSLQTDAFRFVPFAATEPERTLAADIADTEGAACARLSARSRNRCSGRQRRIRAALRRLPALVAAAAVVSLAACGEQEPTYSLRETAKCFRASGYRVETRPVSEPPAARRGFFVGKERRFVVAMYFHKSPGAAKSRERERATLPPILMPGGHEFHYQRRGNVAVSWPDEPGFGPTRSDSAVLDRCLA